MHGLDNLEHHLRNTSSLKEFLGTIRSYQEKGMKINVVLTTITIFLPTLRVLSVKLFTNMYRILKRRL
jgi:hypothetical protein